MKRDPKDQAAVAAAAAAWLAASTDEADIDLDRVLTEQGVLLAGDGAYFEPGSREHDLVHVFLEDGSIIEVNRDGSVVIHQE